MNLKQKEELKTKIEDLEALINCIDSSFMYEQSNESMTKMSVMLLGNLVGIGCQGDRMLALNLLLRMLKDTIRQIKGELND